MRRRLRRFILVAGTTLSVLTASAFVVSGWHLIGVQFTAQGRAVGVTEGCCFFICSSPGGSTFLAIPTSQLTRQRMPNWELWNLWIFLYFEEGIFIPLYALFLAVAVPTLLVWRFVPKFPRGHGQQCGYNLTGNVSGVCPECGATAVKKGDAA